MAASALLFAVEWLLDLPVLKLSPVLALIGGAAFVVKAGILSGTFYLQAATLFLTAGLMCLVPDLSVSLYGLISAVCFFVPGLKYHVQRSRAFIQLLPASRAPKPPTRESQATPREGLGPNARQ